MSGDYYCTLDKEEPHWTCQPGRKYGHTYHSSLESCQKECNRITMVSSLIAIITGVAIGTIGTLAFSFRSYRFHNHNNDEDTEDELLELWHVWDRITQLPLFSGAGHRRFIRAINARKDSQNILAYINFLVKNNPNVKSNIDKIMEKSPHDIAHWANRKIDDIEKIININQMEKMKTILLKAGRPVGLVENGNSEKVLAFKSKKLKSKKRKSIKKRKSTKRKSIKRKTKKSKRKNKKSKKSRKVRKSH